MALGPPTLVPFETTSSIRARRDALVARGEILLQHLSEATRLSVRARSWSPCPSLLRISDTPAADIFFAALAPFPTCLQGALTIARELAVSPVFEDAARKLVEHADTLTNEREIDCYRPLVLSSDTEALTKQTTQALPKLLLIATILDLSSTAMPSDEPAARGSSRIGPGSQWGGIRLRIGGSSHDVGPLSALLDEVRNHHGCAAIPAYYGRVATSAPDLTRVWTAIRPVVRSQRYQAWRDVMASKAARVFAELEARRGMSEECGLSRDARAVVSFLRRRLLPGLLLDVTMIERLHAASAVRARSLELH
jgi:hypothetical protein